LLAKVIVETVIITLAGINIGLAGSMLASQWLKQHIGSLNLVLPRWDQLTSAQTSIARFLENSESFKKLPIAHTVELSLSITSQMVLKIEVIGLAISITIALLAAIRLLTIKPIEVLRKV